MRLEHQRLLSCNIFLWVLFCHGLPPVSDKSLSLRCCINHYADIRINETVSYDIQLKTLGNNYSIIATGVTSKNCI